MCFGVLLRMVCVTQTVRYILFYSRLFIFRKQSKLKYESLRWNEIPCDVFPIANYQQLRTTTAAPTSSYTGREFIHFVLFNNKYLWSEEIVQKRKPMHFSLHYFHIECSLYWFTFDLSVRSEGMFIGRDLFA